MEPTPSLHYYLMLNGKRLGPFDRRTVIGMRLKKLVDNDTQLECSDGSRLTVVMLMATRSKSNGSKSNRNLGFNHEHSHDHSHGHGNSASSNHSSHRNHANSHSSLHSAAGGLHTSSASPVFLLDFGSLWGAGTWGFVGQCELRFQGDHLRLQGLRKKRLPGLGPLARPLGRLLGLKTQRIKLAIFEIESFRVPGADACLLELTLRPSHPLAQEYQSTNCVLRFDHADAVRELLALLDSPPQGR